MTGKLSTRSLQAPEARYALTDWCGAPSQEWHRHPQPRVVFVVDGTFEESSDAVTHRCEAGSVIVRAADALHRDLYVSSGRFVGVALEDESLAELFSSFTARGLHVARAAAFHDLGVRLAVEVHNGDPWSALGAHGLLLEAASLLGRASVECVRFPTWLPSALEMLSADTGSAWTVDLLAERVGRTPADVARTFRRHTGLGVGAYLRRQRLSQARAMIVDCDRPLIEIAADLGYCDQSHFNRSFRRAFGMTPAQYRRSFVRTS